MISIDKDTVILDDGDSIEVDGQTYTFHPSGVDFNGSNISGVDNATVGAALKVPHYTDNTNAVQENRSLWYNDGTGPDASGYYGWDGSTVIGPFDSGSGGSSADVSNNGTSVVSAVGDINFNENITAVNDGDGSVTVNADSLSDLDWRERIVNSPNGNIPNAELEDGESAEISVPVPNNETLAVYRWGAYRISEGTAPSGLKVQLLDGGGVVRASENTITTEDTSQPVAKYKNDTGSMSVFKLAVKNDTGSTITDPGVGAFFAYVVSGLPDPLVTMLDDFERNSPLDEYTGDVSNYTVETVNTISGTQSFGVSSAYGTVARDNSNGETVRGNEYGIQFTWPEDGNMSWGVGVQDISTAGSMDENLYDVFVDGAYDTLYLRKRSGGSNTKSSTISQTLTAGETYELRIEYGAVGDTDNITLKLYDGAVADGAALLGSASITDDEHTGGHWAIYSGDAGYVFDNIVEESL